MGSGEASTLPLAAEEWADELLSRVFAVLSNLDAPAEHRGADAGSGSSLHRGHSFLLASEQSMFRHAHGHSNHIKFLMKFLLNFCCAVFVVMHALAWRSVVAHLASTLDLCYGQAMLYR